MSFSKMFLWIEHVFIISQLFGNLTDIVSLTVYETPIICIIKLITLYVALTRGEFWFDTSVCSCICIVLLSERLRLAENCSNFHRPMSEKLHASSAGWKAPRWKRQRQSRTSYFKFERATFPPAIFQRFYKRAVYTDPYHSIFGLLVRLFAIHIFLSHH